MTEQQAYIRGYADAVLRASRTTKLASTGVFARKSAQVRPATNPAPATQTALHAARPTGVQPQQATTTQPAYPSADDEFVARVNGAIQDVTPFIKRYEKFRPEAYRNILGRDKSGKPIYDKWTLGYGQTEINGRAVQEGDKITEPEASKFVESRLRRNAAALARNNNWTRYLSRGGLSALFDLAYNGGTDIVSRRRSPTLNNTMDDADMDYDGILRHELPTYRFSNGIELPGLLRRRNDAIRSFIPPPEYEQ